MAPRRLVPRPRIFGADAFILRSSCFGKHGGAPPAWRVAVIVELKGGRRAEKVIVSVVAKFVGRTALVDRGSLKDEIYRQPLEAWAKIMPSGATSAK